MRHRGTEETEQREGPLRRTRRLALVISSFLWLGGSSTPALAQIPSVGDRATLEVATWNVEWFGSDTNGPGDEALQRSNVVETIRASGIDLWGLQEVTSVAAFEALLGALGEGYDGYRAPGDVGRQQLAFVWRTDVIQPRSIKTVLPQFDYEFATRLPLEFEATVILPDTAFVATFINLHMKAEVRCNGLECWNRRKAAGDKIKNHIDWTALDDQPVVVLGDFNDRLTGSITAGQPSPYAAFVADADDYRFVSLPLEEAGLGTFCGSSTRCTSGSTIDHILITDELFGAYVEGSTARLDAALDAFDATGEFVRTTSDHLPVYARFDPRTTTDAEDPHLPQTLRIARLYPNPAGAYVDLTVETPAVGEVEVAVYDALGRRVQRTVMAALPGPRRLRLDVGALAPGAYVLRVSAGGAMHTRLFTRLP